MNGANASTAVAISRADFLGFLQEHPIAGLRVLEVLSARLRRADEMIGHAWFLHMAETLAKRLVEFAERTGPPAGGVLSIRWKGYRSLADDLETDPTTIRWWLARFRDNGLVSLERNRLIILQPEELRRGAMDAEVKDTIRSTLLSG